MSAPALDPPPPGHSTVDPEEIARFNRLAATWWDPAGPMRPLHRVNPVRIAFIEEQAQRWLGQSVRGLSVLDLGCGAGLVSEALAARGAEVTGVDAAAPLIAAAKAHAAQSGVSLTYRAGAAEDLVGEGKRFRLVLALEVIEHTADPLTFMQLLAQLAAPGGLVILSTLNRSALSYAGAIVLAEYMLRWLPRGTHEWRRFVRPDEMAGLMRQAGLTPRGSAGFVWRPAIPRLLPERFQLSPRDLSVNYAMAATAPGSS